MFREGAPDILLHYPTIFAIFRRSLRSRGTSTPRLRPEGAKPTAGAHVECKCLGFWPSKHLLN